MREKMIQFVTNFKKAFIPEKNYTHHFNNELHAIVHQRVAEVNCRRIVAISPLLFIGYLMYIILIVVKKNAKYVAMTLTLSFLLIAFTFIMDFIIYWIMIGNDIDNKEETWKFKIIYRLFWPIWFLLMIIISCLQIENGYLGFGLLFTCILPCLIPLYHLDEFIINLIITCIIIVSMITFDSIDSLEYLRTKMELLTFVAMQILGFVCQRMQLMLWMSKEFLYVEAFVDPLTQLLNRRGANEVFNVQRKEYKDANTVGIMMFDIDYFKKYNDHFGHDAGDKCLHMIGEVIRENLKERTKLLIRHGGEEFVVILFNTSKEELLHYAEMLRRAVYDRKFEAPTKEVAEYVTISIGSAIEHLPKEELRYEKMLLRVDKALYEAKNLGKNCVVYAKE